MMSSTKMVMLPRKGKIGKIMRLLVNQMARDLRASTYSQYHQQSLGTLLWHLQAIGQA